VSFDLFLYHFAAGALAEADRAAVKRVLFEARVVERDQNGSYDVPLLDGGSIRVSAPALESDETFDGCAFHLRALSRGHCDFILELAAAGDMVIFNAQGKDEPDNPVLILSGETQAPQVPPGMYKHAVVADSGAHLYTLLDGTYESWERYRAQVVSGTARREK
jgi:hypothetical protein